MHLSVLLAQVGGLRIFSMQISETGVGSVGICESISVGCYCRQSLGLVVFSVHMVVIEVCWGDI